MRHKDETLKEIF